MKKVLNILLIGTIFLQIISCKKEAEPKVSKLDLITANPWIIDQADFKALVSATIYKRGGTGNLYEEASKISLTFKKDGKIAATNQLGVAVEGNWAFNADETRITLPKGLPFSEIIIDNLTATNFDVNAPQFSYSLSGISLSGKLVIKMIPKK
jgi:hypothetical protein